MEDIQQTDLDIEGSEDGQSPQAKVDGKQSLIGRALGFLGLGEEDGGADPRVTFERGKGDVTGKLGFELMREDGVCRIRKGVYARCMRFEDVNYQAARRETQMEIVKRLQDLCNGADVGEGFQWYISVRRISKREFADEMHYEDVPGEDIFNDLRHEQNAILENQIADGAFNVERELYLVVRAEAPNMGKAKRDLDRICSEMERHLFDIGSQVHMLDGREWLELINRKTNPDEPDGTISYEDLLAQPGSSTLDLVAPPYLAKSSSMFMIGEHYAQVLYVQKYSNSVRDDFISQIAELPYNLSVSVHVTALDQTDSIDLVETRLMDLKQEKRNFVLAHPATAMLDDEMLPGSLGDNIVDCKEQRDDLAGGQKMFVVKIAVLCHDRSLSELEQAVESVKSVGRRVRYRISPYARQIEGYRACLPVANDDMPQERNINTAALANFVPFTSDELRQPGGQYMGQNILSKNHIFYDRKNAIAPNGFILGKPGRGKSVTAKNTIMWTLLTDPTARVIVLDPEGEYEVICQLLGGQYIYVDAASETYINPMDITEGYSDDDAGHVDPLTLKTDFIISMIKQMARGLTSQEETLVDRSVGQIYSKWFETGDAADMPTLQDLYDSLKSQPEEAAHQLALTIERYIEGSMKIFNHRSNVDLDNRFVVFGTKNLGKNLSSLGLLILLDQTWNVITQGRQDGSRTWFFVDELQLILDNPEAVRYFDNLWSRARKWYAIPTGITQNVDRLMSNEHTKMMVANSDFLVILGQSHNDAETLAVNLALSDQQFGIIRHAGVGEGLLIADGKVIPFKNEIPKELKGVPTKTYRALTTKPEDLEEMREAGILDNWMDM